MAEDEDYKPRLIGPNIRKWPLEGVTKFPLANLLGQKSEILLVL